MHVSTPMHRYWICMWRYICIDICISISIEVYLCIYNMIMYVEIRCLADKTGRSQGVEVGVAFVCHRSSGHWGEKFMWQLAAGYRCIYL